MRHPPGAGGGGGAEPQSPVSACFKSLRSAVDVKACAVASYVAEE